jgi:hypothetical protein
LRLFLPPLLQLSWLTVSAKSQAESARIQAQVAKRTWRTQNERIVLDLFERRISIFEGIRKVVAEALRTGPCAFNVFGLKRFFPDEAIKRT